MYEEGNFHVAFARLDAKVQQCYVDWLLEHSRPESLETLCEWVTHKLEGMRHTNRLRIGLEDRRKVTDGKKTNASQNSSVTVPPGPAVVSNPAGHKEGTSLAKKEDASAVSSGSSCCPLCMKPHLIHLCPILKALTSPDSRQQLIVSNKLCFNCLSSDHIVTDCTNPNSCDSCPHKHHTLLHGTRPGRSRQNPRQAQPSQQEDGPRTEAPKMQAMSRNNTTSPGEPGELDDDEMISLGIVPIEVFNTHTRRSVVINALIDNGAQDCFLTTWAA